VLRKKGEVSKKRKRDWWRKEGFKLCGEIFVWTYLCILKYIKIKKFYYWNLEIWNVTTMHVLHQENSCANFMGEKTGVPINESPSLISSPPISSFYFYFFESFFFVEKSFTIII